MRSLFLLAALVAALFGSMGSSVAQIDGPLIAVHESSFSKCLFESRVDLRSSRLERIPPRRSSKHGGLSKQLDIGCNYVREGRFHVGSELHLDLYMDSERLPFRREGGDAAGLYIGYEFWTPLVDFSLRAKGVILPPVQTNRAIQLTANISRSLSIGPLTVAPWLEVNQLFLLWDVQNLTFVDYGLRIAAPLSIMTRYLNDFTLITHVGVIHNVTPFVGPAARFVEPSLSRPVTKHFDASIDWKMFSFGWDDILSSRFTYRRRIDDHDGEGRVGLNYKIRF